MWTKDGSLLPNERESKERESKEVKCVQFQGKWLTPNEFERIAGATAKKMEAKH